MKKLIIVFFVLTSIVSAQQKITLDEIWGGTFRADRMQSFNALQGNFYAVLNYDRATNESTIDKYDFATLEKVNTILSTAENLDIKTIEDYQLIKMKVNC